MPCDCTLACVPATVTCAPAMVEQVVMVPEMITETRKVLVTEYQPEEKRRTYTVQRLMPKTEIRTGTRTVMVPVTRTIEKQYTVMVPRIETRTGIRTVMRPVTRTVERQFTVMVPKTETKTGVRTIRVPVTKTVEQDVTVMVPKTETKTGIRTVYRCIPVQKTYTVCEDQGHWEQRPLPAMNGCNPCGAVASCCGGCPHHGGHRCHAHGCAPTCCPAPACMQQVWVPNIVNREVTTTVQEMQAFQEEYQYQVTTCEAQKQTRWIEVTECEDRQEEFSYDVTVCVPETRTCQVQMTECVPDQQEFQYNVIVCVPETITCQVQVSECEAKQEEYQYQVTTCEAVSEEKTETYTVHVPVQVEKEIQVQVCRMVEKRIQVPAPSCCSVCPTSACGGCCR
jgi:hypothetical protein